MLAESYEVSDDGMVYTFKLRQGVKFHNGEEMKADDVVASMNRWLELSAKANTLIGGSVFEEVDDYTVKMTANLACIPHLGVEKGKHLPVVPGTVPPLTKIPEGCHFCTRCKDADARCQKAQPPLCEAEPGHLVKCWKYADAKKQEQED